MPLLKLARSVYADIDYLAREIVDFTKRSAAACESGWRPWVHAVAASAAFGLLAGTVAIVATSRPVAAPLAGGYWLTRVLALRWLAGVYLVAFLVALFQNRALIGDTGLLPARRLLRRADASAAAACGAHQFPPQAGMLGRVRLACARVERLPTLLWLADWSSLNRWLDALALSGALLSGIALVRGGASAWHLLAMWVLYHSIVAVGQRWYSFGWESQLLETGLLAVLAAPSGLLGCASPSSALPAGAAPPLVAVQSFRWLAFRIMLGAGLINRDAADPESPLAAVPQPAETGAAVLHRVQPRHRARRALPAADPLVPGAGCLWRHARGVPAEPDPDRQPVVPELAHDHPWALVLRRRPAGGPAAPGGGRQLMNAAFERRIVVPGWVLGGPRPRASAAKAEGNEDELLAQKKRRLSDEAALTMDLRSLRLLNTYGAFGSVNLERVEIVFEGSRDLATWLPYVFKAAVDDPRKRPRWLAPYHLRLDWCRWIASCRGRRSNGMEEPWALAFVHKLLQGDAEVRSLLAHGGDPFEGGAPPLRVRAELYRYAFAPPPRSAADPYWLRERVGTYLPPLDLGAAASRLVEMGMVD